MIAVGTPSTDYSPLGANDRAKELNSAEKLGCRAAMIRVNVI